MHIVEELNLFPGKERFLKNPRTISEMKGVLARGLAGYYIFKQFGINLFFA
jgi:hypothetical protein